ncbi:DEMETER-like protein 2 [Durio zibethinus]|uniref:DEMETER-like protein 2 n=1 Tax=Durio zibethinus TaxID=66656 RepID=A0A6P5XTQ4_DURZI|nr:DEMETER-like protein 2 [Durio zibethinus]
MYRVYKSRPKRPKCSNSIEEKKGRKEQCCLVPVTPAKPRPGRSGTKKVYERRSRKKLATLEKDCDLLSGSSLAMNCSNEMKTLMDCDKPSASCATMISSDESIVLFTSCVALTGKGKEQSSDRTESISVSLGSVVITDLNMSLDSRCMINLNAREEKEQVCVPGLIELNISKERSSDGTAGCCLESTGFTSTSKEKEHSFDGIERACQGSAGLIDLNKRIYSLENVDGSNEQVMQTHEGESTCLVSDTVIECTECLDILGFKGLNDWDSVLSSIPFIELSLSESKDSQSYVYAHTISQGSATDENFKLNHNFKKSEHRPKRKKYRPKVVIDGKANTPKLATPKQEKETKFAILKQNKKRKSKIAAPKQINEKVRKEVIPQPLDLSEIETKAPVARALDFHLESLHATVDFACPKKKRRSRRRRKLNWFDFIIMNMNKNGKKSKKRLFTVNWCGKKRRLQKKRPQKVRLRITSTPVTDVQAKIDVSCSENNGFEVEVRVKSLTEMETPALIDGTCKSITESNISEFQKVTGKRKRKEQPSDVTKGRSGFLSKKNIHFIIRKLQSLHISDKYTLVPYKVPLLKIMPKVDLDAETVRVWNLLMHTEHDRIEEKVNEENEKWWEKERELFVGRVSSFISCMHQIQGDRGFRKWKGSVLDSVIGVFLTQNASDHFSSNAFMALAAKFPPPPTNQNSACDQESIGSNMTAIQTEFDEEGNKYFVNEPESERNKEFGKELDLIGGIEETCSMQIEDLNITNCCVSHGLTQEAEMEKPFESSHCYQSQNMPIDTTTISKRVRGKIPKAKEHGFDKKRKSNSREKKKNASVPDSYWETLRIRYSTGQRSNDQMDSVDWDAVRLADLNEVAGVIQLRGQQILLATRIQNFLNRLIRIHKCLDLEWLRNTPPDQAKAYLLEVEGLGLKSVECIRLLSLRHAAFPVDTNVGRIAVRLGWVPLQELPDELKIHLLELYPIQNSIQIYLWPRLCTFQQELLYELHYQMITFGKVFCTKKNPNCNECPMRGDCSHFASQYGSERYITNAIIRWLCCLHIKTVECRKNALPGPSDKIKASSAAIFNPLTSASSSEPIPLLGSGHQIKICEPIIEEPFEPPAKLEPPKSQEPESVCGDSEGIPIIKLNRDFRTTLCSQSNIICDGESSKALVALTSHAASIPALKLRRLSRLRSEHLVYELPRNHVLLQGLEQTESDKDVQYHVAIWTSGETADSLEPPKKSCNSTEFELCNEQICFSCNNIREQNDNIVRGTILIPYRVANRSSFPLNGTYFQSNEVFADHETSLRPINIPRDLIYNLPTRIAYFGSSISTILRGVSTEDIRRCFWAGIVCVRGFERSTRTPRPLVKRFYCPASKREKVKREPSAILRKPKNSGKNIPNKLLSQVLFQYNNHRYSKERYLQ